MTISPISAGDGRPQPWTFTTVADDGTKGVFTLAGLTNGALALHIEDINNNLALYVCTGAWAITGDGTAGKATFTPSVADVTTGSLGKAGLYKIYPVVTLGTGPVAMDAQTIQVVSLP